MDQSKILTFGNTLILSDRCNCGVQNTTEWYGLEHDIFWTDEGYITDKDALPIRSVYLDDIISSFEAVLIMQLGPLICEESKYS